MSIVVREIIFVTFFYSIFFIWFLIWLLKSKGVIKNISGTLMFVLSTILIVILLGISIQISLGTETSSSGLMLCLSSGLLVFCVLLWLTLKIVSYQEGYTEFLLLCTAENQEGMDKSIFSSGDDGFGARVILKNKPTAVLYVKYLEGVKNIKGININYDENLPISFCFLNYLVTNSKYKNPSKVVNKAVNFSVSVLSQSDENLNGVCLLTPYNTKYREVLEGNGFIFAETEKGKLFYKIVK